jgi:hypothetical protein
MQKNIFGWRRAWRRWRSGGRSRASPWSVDSSGGWRRTTVAAVGDAAGGPERGQGSAELGAGARRSTAGRGGRRHAAGGGGGSDRERATRGEERNREER